MAITTVYDLFRSHYPDLDITDDMQANLQSMPLDSTCGDDCARTIAASASLLRHIRAAYGDNHPDYIAVIGDITASVIQCYICG